MPPRSSLLTSSQLLYTFSVFDLLNDRAAPRVVGVEGAPGVNPFRFYERQNRFNMDSLRQQLSFEANGMRFECREWHEALENPEPLSHYSGRAI